MDVQSHLMVMENFTDINDVSYCIHNLLAIPNREPDLEAAVLEKWMLTGQRGHLDAWLKKHGKDKIETSLCFQGWIFFNNFMGIFYITALIREGRSETFDQAKKYLSIATDSEHYKFSKVYEFLNSVLDYLTGNSTRSRKRENIPGYPGYRGG